MKKLFSVLFAASVLATPLAMASEASAAPANKPAVIVEKNVVKKKIVVRKGGWVKGRRLSASDRSRAASVDYRRHRLSAPPRGYHWVRIHNSFLLVGITSGLISKVQIAH
ncbi:RcnB family protein [Rhizobium leucaenae]|uniref:Ni/Co efflux regulator RcnB n=1 Tax=Rhizobium leucaenae TaxID=29450 RepID=A0A7W6ZW22_9HYPH|nr:RcnB family protein [Rhizobium leucaenae]MBB4569813.1 Ni/Co efflux regulator RcnB [Rhizobium leucaenae]MBB6299674.1 Ni/Co efflux regulator RcnB [Rhizobium leucaenae]